MRIRLLHHVDKGLVLGVVVALFAGAGFIQNESATYPGWRGIFWLGGSLIALYGILTFMLYKPTPAPYQRAAENLSFAKKVSELDTIGSLFLAGALIPLLMGLIWGEEPTSYRYIDCT